MNEYTVFHQMPWPATYAVYFFLIGIAASLFFLSALSWFRGEFLPLRRTAFMGSFGLLAVGGLLLIMDLSQPARFINMLNPAYLQFSSPLAWGGLNLLAFGVVGVLYFLTMGKGDEKRARLLAVLGSLLALGLPIYTGFDLSVHQARPVWNTPMMPLLFVALSLVSGAAVASFLAGGSAELLASLRKLMLWSAGAVGVMLVSLIGTTAYGGAGAELTFMFLTTGTLGLLFVGLGLIGGTAAPIALLLAPVGRQQQVVWLSALLILAGGMALRYTILLGGQLVQTYY